MQQQKKSVWVLNVHTRSHTQKQDNHTHTRTNSPTRTNTHTHTDDIYFIHDTRLIHVYIYPEKRRTSLERDPNVWKETHEISTQHIFNTLHTKFRSELYTHIHRHTQHQISTRTNTHPLVHNPHSRTHIRIRTLLYTIVSFTYTLSLTRTLTHEFFALSSRRTHSQTLTHTCLSFTHTRIHSHTHICRCSWFYTYKLTHSRAKMYVHEHIFLGNNIRTLILPAPLPPATLFTHAQHSTAASSRRYVCVWVCVRVTLMDLLLHVCV